MDWRNKSYSKSIRLIWKFLVNKLFTLISNTIKKSPDLLLCRLNKMTAMVFLCWFLSTLGLQHLEPMINGIFREQSYWCSRYCLGIKTRYFNILENIIWFSQGAAAGIQSSNITHHKLLNFILESVLLTNWGANIYKWLEDYWILKTQNSICFLLYTYHSFLKRVTCHLL